MSRVNDIADRLGAAAASPIFSSQANSTVLRFATLCLLIAGCPAMELTIADVPLTVGTAPTKYSYEISGDLGSQSGSDAVDLGTTVRLGLRKGWPQRARSQGLVVGAELGFDQYQITIGNARRVGLNGLLGWGWAPADHVSFVVSAVAGLGYGTITLDDSQTLPGWSGSGRSTTVGARLATLVNLSRYWLIEVDLGWEAIDHRASADGTTVRIAPAGLTTGVGVVYRFDPIPVRLE